MARKNPIPAFAYLRTSSAANVGPDKDSERRQILAIEAFAKRSGFTIAGTFFDAAVRGADAVDVRPGFAELLKHIEANGCRTIIVETANRFARDLVVQETGYAMLRERGIDLIAADSPSAFLDDGPTSKLIRQVLGAVAEFDKAMTVAKLKGARERAKKLHGRKTVDGKAKCEGRKSFAETHPAVVAEAKRLRRASPVTHERRSLREIAEALADAGHLNKAGKPYHPDAIARMLAQRIPGQAEQGAI